MLSEPSGTRQPLYKLEIHSFAKTGACLGVNFTRKGSLPVGSHDDSFW